MAEPFTDGDGGRVWIPRVPDEPFATIVREQLHPRWRVLFGDDGDADECDVLVAGRPTAEQLGPSVRSVIVPFAGIPPTTRELLLEHPEITLHNLHHNAAPTAEMAVGLMLAVAKRVVPADAALRRGDWTMRYDHDNALLLAGRTAVIVGYGAIGQRIGDACRGLGMHVVGVRRSAASDLDDGRGVDQLPDLLPEADVLFLAVPSTPETKGLLGASALRRLPKHAIVVNVARGPVIDEEPFYRALEAGELWGAGLDVWWSYPESEEERPNTAPSQFEFGVLENVVLSPHRAGHGDATEELRAQHLVELLNRGRVGEFGNRADVQAGY